MFPETRYLRWAMRFYGQVPHDLASSGIPRIGHRDLPPLPALDDAAGPARLKEAIAKFNDVPASEVVATLGASHALWVAYATLLSPGDELLVEDPSYEPLWRAAEASGVGTSRFERRAEDGFAIDPEHVAASMTDRTKVVAVTNLHNPTGVRTTDEVLRELARTVGARGAHLLVDEVYAPFDGLVGASGVWGKTARHLGDNVIVASSLTKCFGAGDQRVGWVLAPRAVIARAEDALVGSLGHLPVEHANMGVHVFRHLPALAERARASLEGKREIVARWVLARADLHWSRPTSGLFGFAWRPGAGDLTARIERGASDLGVLVGAGAFFGMPEGFRLAWSLPREDLATALEKLEELLSASP